MFARALVVWLGLVVLAIANGGLRQAVFVPRLGERAAHILSSLLLSALILLAAWSAIEWIDPSSVRGALSIGALWVTLTIVFEFGAGRYAFGHSWTELFADYDVRRGRVWVLVLVVTALAPLAAACVRRVPGVAH